MIKKVSKLMFGMALTRQELNSKLGNLLTGAFGEFMKRQVALAIQEPMRAHDWSVEVKTHLFKVKYYMSDEVTVTIKNKVRVFLTACSETEGPLEVTQAKNKLSEYLPKKENQIRKLKFDSKEEFIKMIQEFLPEYVDDLIEHWKEQ